jgi:hypothetical protein
VAPQVERHDAESRRQAWRHLVPDVRVESEAVEQDQRRADVAPLERVQRETVGTRELQ